MGRTDEDRRCPRDKRVLEATPMGRATVDVCSACQGAFFDSGDMLAAAGLAADPLSWDRPEATKGVKGGTLACPRCEVLMHAQDVTREGESVEIDRCGKCGGVWLDKGELDTLTKIGEALRPLVESEQAKARKEADAIGDVKLKERIRWWKLALLVVPVAAILGLYLYGKIQDRAEREQRREEEQLRKRGCIRLDDGTLSCRKGEEGCPCGCDHSTAMAAELRKQGGEVALHTIDQTLVTIGERENAGYVTERMIKHRLRLLEVADEIRGQPTPLPLFHHHRERDCTSAKDEKLGACADLVVHGERVEIVKGKPKLITSSFKLWLEIENLTSEERSLAPPSLRARTVHLPVTRWYEDGGRGTPWDGHLGPHAKARINVIGDIPDRVEPGAPIDSAIELDGLVITTSTEARAVIHLSDD
jgi:Zn-finger nucleic acid-binding protein